MKKRFYLNYGGLTRLWSQDQSLHESQSLVQRKWNYVQGFPPQIQRKYVRSVCLGTLWGLGKNAPMTIRPTFTTKLFSSAILYSTDISPSPWLGCSLQGAVHFPPHESRDAVLVSALLLTRQSPCTLPPPYSLLGTTDMVSVLHKVPHKLSLSPLSK